MSRTVAIRTELLKKQGEGFSNPEIVKHLKATFDITKAGVYYHLNSKDKWIDEYSKVFGKDLGATIRQRFDHVYREASFRYLQSREDNARIGFLKVMLETNKVLLSFYSSDSVLDDRPIQLSFDIDKYKISNNMLDPDKPLRDYKKVQRKES